MGNQMIPARVDHINNLQNEVRDSKASLKQTVEWHIHNFMSSNTRVFFSECEFQIELAIYLRAATPYIIHAEYTLKMPKDKNLNSAVEMFTEEDENNATESNTKKVDVGTAHIDLVVEDKENNLFLPIELKYCATDTVVTGSSEFGSYGQRNLTDPSADNMRCYDVWKDVLRVVYLKKKYRETVKDGLVIFLSNEENYWTKPQKNGKKYDAFRLFDGREVGSQEHLCWGDGASEKLLKSRPDIDKIGADVVAKWYDAKDIDGIKPRFRYLILDPQ